ncbi:MAG: lytic transglycosylase domain-containing protein [Ottowia sp.]|nr:lytic transglycosylase domain-containing protein [Ottowia sp.]
MLSRNHYDKLLPAGMRTSRQTFTTWIKHVLVLLGSLAVLCALSLACNPSWRAQFASHITPTAETELHAVDNGAQIKTDMSTQTLFSSQNQRTPMVTLASAHITSASNLESDKIALARYIARRYRVAHMATQQLVQVAHRVGNEFALDPLLLLAIMAIESSFNPYAESVAGAQGLMQVMTRVHEDKYAHLGGKAVALDPLANIRVGARVLKDCITRAGSLERGLKFYVGAATMSTDTGYGARVLAERERMRQAIDAAQIAQTKLSQPVYLAVNTNPHTP